MSSLKKELLLSFMYSVGFSLLCKSFTDNIFQTISIGAILGFFASRLYIINSNLIKKQ